MDRATKTLILGIALGVAAVALGVRLRQIIEEQDPEALVERLQSEMDDLEARVKRS